MKIISIQKALKGAADNPADSDDNRLDMPIHEHIAHKLWDIANYPNHTKRGSMRRATRAQKIIMDYMVGLRKPGSLPLSKKGGEIEFVDLTAGIPGPADDSGD